MKQDRLSQTYVPLATAVTIGFLASVLFNAFANLFSPPLRAQESSTKPISDVAALRVEIDALKGKLPDQAHAMADVGYHFSNLWFAGQQQNWPLAKFCLDETRSHLKWAVRIIPVRKTKAGDLELGGLLEAVDKTFLGQIQKSIDAADREKFATAYKDALTGCYSCHVASEKPFIRVQIPERPEATIVSFDPETK